MGEYRANNLCWNPAKVAFERDNPTFPGTFEKRLRLYTEMPGSWIEVVDNDVYFPKSDVILWSDCPPDRCEEHSKPDFPDLKFFRAECISKQHALLKNDLNWITPLIDTLKSNNLDLSNYDYKILVMGKSGPIIPQDGEREKYHFCTTAMHRIVGYNAGAIVMSENGLKMPSYYFCEGPYSGGGTPDTIFKMPGWQGITHEVLHAFGACDVYEAGIGTTTCRNEALKLESAEEVDKSIMANGWAGYCGRHKSKYSCTIEDAEKIYLDRYNRIKLGLE